MLQSLETENISQHLAMTVMANHYTTESSGSITGNFKTTAPLRMQVNTLVRGTSLALMPLSALPANLMPTPTVAKVVLQN